MYIVIYFFYKFFLIITSVFRVFFIIGFLFLYVVLYVSCLIYYISNFQKLFCWCFTNRSCLIYYSPFFLLILSVLTVEWVKWLRSSILVSILVCFHIKLFAFLVRWVVSRNSIFFNYCQMAMSKIPKTILTETFYSKARSLCDMNNLCYEKKVFMFRYTY